MNEQEALSRMVAPGTRKPGKYREGVVQIHVTRACDRACYGCTQGSNLAGKTTFISPEHFEQAVLSLKGYFGVVGVFGGNPCLHPQFEQLCSILRKHVPFEQRGLWSNNLMGKGRACQATFDPSVSNLNVHLDYQAFLEMKRDWPECSPVGLSQDSRHSPCYVALKDVVSDEGERWELISNCDINRHWSAMMGVFRGELRAWFCEIAGAQAMLHQDEMDYPDTGLNPNRLYDDGEKKWWQLPMHSFSRQVVKHCHECSVPIRGYGALAQGREEDETEQVSETHRGIFRPKRRHRRVELVVLREQVKEQQLVRMTDYIGNARR